VLPGCSGFPNPELNIYRISNPDMKNSGLGLHQMPTLKSGTARRFGGKIKNVPY
jgi:starvation-inducible outer membrane lipoprotein